MATTPDERQEKQGRLQGLIESVRVVARKESGWNRAAVSLAVFAAIGADRPGTSIAVAALLFVYLGRK